MKLNKVLKFILLCVAIVLMYFYLKTYSQILTEQESKERECINKRVEINGSSYLIVAHDWFKDCYILDNGLPVDEELIWELLKEQK